MAKLIIWVSGRPIIYGYARNEFKWSEEYKRFIYLGKELSEQEFNDVIDKVMNRHEDKHPSVKVIADSVSGAPAPVDEVPCSDEMNDDTALAHAITTIERLAPDRLKKAPGRRPAAVPA